MQVLVISVANGQTGKRANGQTGKRANGFGNRTTIPYIRPIWVGGRLAEAKGSPQRRLKWPFISDFDREDIGQWYAPYHRFALAIGPAADRRKHDILGNIVDRDNLQRQHADRSHINIYAASACFLRRSQQLTDAMSDLLGDKP